MKRLLKCLLIVLKCGWYLLYCYFAWILPYSRHPEKYPLDMRYARVRKLVIFILKHARMDLVVENVPNFDTEESQFFVSNHVSALDPLFLVAYSKKPIRFIAKQETRKLPFAGRVLRAMDALFLDRDDPRQAIRIFQNAYGSIERKEAHICIFPEGTRNKDPEHKLPAPFHPGSFKIACKKKMDIHPLVVFGSTNLLGTNKLHRNQLVQVSFLDTMKSEAVAAYNTVDLANVLHEQVVATFERLRDNDTEYYTEKKFIKKRPKWWEELPS